MDVRQQVLYDKKWFAFLKRTWLFRYVPFIDFVFGSGSMAVGNVDDESDFDVLIGARQRRIFTARFFAILFFGLLRWRRKKGEYGARAADKVCLNHFITPASYRFALEANPYWERMYQGLVPVFGDERFMRVFVQANEALIKEPKRVINDLRFKHRTSSWLKLLLESLLSGGLGDWLERVVKARQVARIEAGLPNKGGEPHRLRIALSGVKPATYTLPALIKYSDVELQFHPNPIHIEVVS